MTVEIISLSISTKVWDQARIELGTSGSAVRLTSVARHVTDCASRPGHSRVGRFFFQLSIIQITLELEQKLLYNNVDQTLLFNISKKWAYPRDNGSYNILEVKSLSLNMHAKLSNEARSQGYKTFHAQLN